jgi:enoyl-CoA hydratase/long-chain 3-hydroxyacyl-CoA dehydrogenase
MFVVLKEGVGPKEIDTASKNFGFPVGNATLLDEVGIDVAAHIAEFLSKELGERATSKAGLGILKDLVSGGFTGRFLFTCFFDLIFTISNSLNCFISNKKGRKASKGVYLYQEGVKGSDRQINPAFLDIIGKYKTEPKIK